MENIRTFIQTKNKEYKELLASNAAEDKQYEENIKAIEKSIHRFFIESREILEERKKSTFEKIGITAEEWEANQAAYNEICEAAIAELDSWYSFKKEKLEKKYKSDLSSLQISRDRESIVNELEGNATAADTKQAIAVLSNAQNKYREEINLIINKYKLSLQQLYQNSSYTDISRHQIPAELFEKIREYYRLTNKIHTLDREYSIDNSASLSYYDKREKEISAEYTAKKEALEKDYHKKSAEIRKGVEELNSLAEKIVWIERQQNTGVQNIGEDIHSNQYLTDEQSRELYELRRKRTELLETHQSVKITNEKRLSEFLDGVKEKLLSYKDKESDYQIKTPSEYKPAEQLPETICIGEYTTPMEKCELTNALFEQKQFGTSNSIFLDVRNCGNIIINTHSYEDETNETLYRVVSGLALRYLQSFPIGSLKVHFVDTVQLEWFKKFINGFSGDRIDATLINNYAKIPEGELERVNIQCNAVSKKFINRIDDLFALYEIDQTHQFQLFVIRSGFSDFVKRDAGMLRSFSNLMGEHGRKAGIRFIVVNDYNNPAYMEENKEHLLSSIYSNAQVFDFSDCKLSLGNTDVHLSKIIENDALQFIEDSCRIMAKCLSEKSQNKISYEDIGFGKAVDTPQDYSCITIPVGKYGSEVVEIPFQCNSGGNIGVLLAGRSGFGKSSVFHSIVINGCMKYSPDDLELWLLDFKEGEATTIYKYSKIPHIRLISEYNRPEDAYNLFLLLIKELENRHHLKNNAVLHGVKLSDIAAYNKYVDANPEFGEHMSRILVVIDEAQKMFIDEQYSSEIASLILRIAQEGRSVGIHMVMLTQNLSSGKSYLLKENFLVHIGGKISLHLAETLVNDSEFGSQFNELKTEISTLKRGEAYATFDGTTPKKIAFAFCDDDDFERYFAAIRKKYDKYSQRLKILGKKELLYPSDVDAESGRSYLTYLQNPLVENTLNGTKYSFTFGEDGYSLQPISFTFDSTPSYVCAVGNDDGICSSICSNLLISAAQLKDKTIYVCNGSVNERIFSQIISMYQSDLDIHEYTSDNIDKLIETIALEYYERQKSSKIPRPIFVIINNLASISKIRNNVVCNICINPLQNNVESSDEIQPIDDIVSEKAMEVATEKEMGYEYLTPNSEYDYCSESNRILTLISEIAEFGVQYGIYFNITTPYTNKFSIDTLFDTTKNKLLFNDIPDNAMGIFGSYDITETLKQIKNRSGRETVVLSFNNGKRGRVRPVLYDEEALNSLQLDTI